MISRAIHPFGENCWTTRPAYCVPKKIYWKRKLNKKNKLVESFDPIIAAIDGRSREHVI